MSDDDIVALRTLQEGFESRPKNTNLAYNKKALEFIRWCDSMNYPDSSTVTGKKLHHFLKEQVCHRKSKKDSKKTIGFYTLRTYKSAIIDLYMQQKGLNQNSNEHPGVFPSLKSLMDQYKRGQNTRNKANYSDRGHGTLLEGFTTAEDLLKMSNYYLELNKPVAIRNRLLFLLPHFSVCRGENVRSLQLPDLFYLKLDSEGYSVCYAVVLIMSQGKRNQFGKKEFGAFIRNKNVLVCPMGALATFFFVRYHIQNVPFPTMWRNRDWYDLMLAPGEDPVSEISYSTHYKFIKDMLDALGVKSEVKTHMGRGTGSRMADVLGAAESDIRRSGRWNQQAVSCYLTSLPRETMRTLAGFPKDRGHFYIPRAAVEPPEALKDMIFPDVSKWASVHGLHGASEPDSNAEHSIATDGFLMLMTLIRTVFLQDSIYLRDAYPNLFIWKHPIFQCEQYHEFAAMLKDAVDTSTVPQEERLQLAVPLIAEKLTDMTRVMQDQHNIIHNKLDTQYAVHTNFQQKMADIFSGRSNIRIQTDSFPYDPMDIEPMSSDENNAPLSLTTDKGIPSYVLCRSLTTVNEVWVEYTIGFGSNPAVRDLENTFGTKWRTGPKEQRYFCRRNILYKEIMKLVSNGFSEADAVNQLETLRVSKKFTLDALQKYLHINDNNIH
jgi:hypothetical protein